MAATPATLQQLARDAARANDPESALRAISALRDELARLEPVHVAACLQVGYSWSRIAGALGISKQGAHKRHAKLAREATAAAAGAPKILVTSEARRAVRNARGEAEALGHRLVGTEHLLLGILRCRYSPAVKALRRVGIELDAARGTVEPTATGEGDEPAAGDRDHNPLKERGLTAHAHSVLERSLHESIHRGEGYIGVEHLLLALIHDPRSGATRTLSRLGATPDDVHRALDQAW